MTDLGSVVFETDKHSEHTNGVIHPPQNSKVHSSRPSHKKTQARPRPPSPILESPENNWADSGIEESTWSQGQETEKDVSIDKGKDTCVHNSDQDVIDPSSARHSLTSEEDFGSSDILTDNDSLENVHDTGHTNLVADVTVHAGTVATGNSDGNTKPSEGDGKTLRFSDVALQMYQKVHKERTTAGKESEKDSETENEIKNEQCSEKVNEKEEVSQPVKVEEIDVVDSAKEREADLEDIERQIIVNSQDISNYGAVDHSDGFAQDNNDAAMNNTCSKDSVGQLNTSVSKAADNDAQITDLNRNQTKSSVRFKDQGGGEIQEERIIPTEAQPVEGLPRIKKDAASRRETWASRKLKRTFGLKDKEKYEVEDQVDGKGK